MVTAVVFEFSVMRCQPLRRALGCKLCSVDCVVSKLVNVV
ncbi:acetyltransferase [Vibrio mimicus]